MAIDGIGGTTGRLVATTSRPGATARADGQGIAGDLSPAQARLVAALKQRDREVRAHELAHLTAAGGLANGGASFTYQRGPDGVDYAIGGEVSISLQEGRTPEETIANARTIKAAALAPADPSAQDRAVAAAAAAMEARALAEQLPKPAPDLASPGSDDGAASALARVRDRLARTYRDGEPAERGGFSIQA